MNRQAFTTPQIVIFVLALAVVVGGYFAFGPKTQAPQPGEGRGSLNHGELEISSPEPNAAISSPLVIHGRTTSGWIVSEGKAGVALVNDGNGQKLGQSTLQVVGDWTKPIVEFEATITFEKPTTPSGQLSFYDANPSGDPDLTHNYVLPVKFTTAVSTSTDTAGWQIYTNSQYGFQFQYDPKNIKIQTEGNIVYVDFANESVHSGDYIEVFNKNSGDSITDAIKKAILGNFPSAYCNIQNITDSYSQLKAIWWMVVSISDNNPNQDGPVPSNNECNNKYLNAGSPGLFLYKQASPSAFLFWRSGAALNNDQIFSTFKFTSQ